MHAPNPPRPQVQSLAHKASGPGSLCCRYTRGGQVLLRSRPNPAPDVDHELLLNRFATTLVSAHPHRP